MFTLISAEKNSIWRERILRYAPLILWIGVIFYLSGSQGSMSKTSIFIRPILMFLFPNAPEETLTIYHGYIRKCAHFTVYAALAFFAFRAFSSSAKTFLKNFRFPVSLLLVFITALLDEFNQSFLTSRTSSFRDVLLDTFGGLMILTIVSLVGKWRNS